MEKRLTRTEMIFSLGFLFMLILAVAAFFYGVKVGSEKTDANYIQMKHLNSEGGPKVTAYQQQDLVTYYHTVFLPLREFQTEWFSAIEKLESGRSTDAAASFKELAKQAKKTIPDHYDRYHSCYIPASCGFTGQCPEKSQTVRAGFKPFGRLLEGQVRSSSP